MGVGWVVDAAAGALAVGTHCWAGVLAYGFLMSCVRGWEGGGCEVDLCR